MGFTFAFTESLVANERQKSDPISSATGACAAGFLAGVRSTLYDFIRISQSNSIHAARSLPTAVGSCVVLGAAVGAFDFAGTLSGAHGPSLEEKRKKFFKPGTPIPDLS